MCDERDAANERDPNEIEWSVERLLGELRLSQDLRAAARCLSPQHQRLLVDLYYQIQEDRKRAMNQRRAAAAEPNAWVTFVGDYLARMEKLIAGALDLSTNSLPVSVWAKAQVGIGPVITAGLAAYIDLSRTPAVSGLWRLAGLDPTSTWEKGQKRPWNAQLKVLRWKIGHSFMQFHNKATCFYGHVYAKRKALEVQRNEAGQFAAQAAATLATRQIKDPETRAIYAAGKLPAGRLELRAERVAVKLFLAHYWEVGYYHTHGTWPPVPYIIAAQPALHTQYIPPPGYEDVCAGRWARQA